MRSALGAVPAFVSVIALTAVLVGCATLAPHYTRPPSPVAASYPDTATAIGSAVVTAAWRDYFTDPRLQQLIARALENNRDLRVAAFHVQESRAAFGIQRANLFPSLSLNAYTLRAGVPGSDFNGQSLGVFRLSQLGLNLSPWEIDFWGRLRSLKTEALEQYLASDESRREVTITLITQVANTYFTIRALDERIRLAQRTIASRQESFRIFRRRVEVGSTSRLDLRQVETLLTQAQALLTQLEQERAAQAHALTLLVGEPAELAVASVPFKDQGGLQELRSGLPSDLLVRRPDILAAEHQLRAANANIGAARAAFFPRVTLIGSVGTGTAELDGLFSSPSLFSAGFWTFLPTISVPIFNAGSNRKNLDLSVVRRNSAVSNYEKTIQEAFRDVSDALSDRWWLIEQLRIQETALAALTDRARLARLRYDRGATSFLDVLDADRDLLSGEQDLVEVRRQLVSSRVRLYAALGGGA